MGLCLFVTRSYRRARNFLAIAIGYGVVMISSVGSAFLLSTRILEMMNIDLTRVGDAAWYAYMLTFITGSMVTIRIEMRWRKAVGIRDQTLIM